MTYVRYLQKLNVFMKLGKDLATLSTCKRAQVGAVIVPVDLTAIYAIGYNGPAAGLPNYSCTGAEGTCGCVHAEANAVMKLNTSQGDRPCLLYTTHRPCMRCAGFIINCRRIIGVVWSNEYRESIGEAMIQAIKIPILSDGTLLRDVRYVDEWRQRAELQK
jgi:deoxycytidylate deaminase